MTLGSIQATKPLKSPQNLHQTLKILKSSMKILAGNSNKALAKSLALALNADYVESSITYFKDSETKIQILQSLSDEDVAIVQSTSRPVNNHLIELLLLIDVAKRAKAKQIIVIMPYFGYSRQDRKFSDESTIPAQLIANLLQTAGATSVITIDLHSSTIEDFFEIPFQNLDPINLYLPFLRNYNNFTVVSPDNGSTHRVQKIKELLNVDIAIISKQRDINNQCEMVGIDGNVREKNCVIIDDLIDSGETICKAAEFLITHGALSVDIFVTHPVLSPGSLKNIKNSSINNIYVTDTIKVATKKIINSSTKFHIIPVVSVIAQALQCCIQ